jgi:hypothetical protein
MVFKLIFKPSLDPSTYAILLDSSSGTVMQTSLSLLIVWTAKSDRGGRSLPSRHTKQAERNRMEQISSSLRAKRVSAGPDGCDWGRASQFDPAIDKERKLISNLRWNMPVLVQTVSNIWPSG